MDFNKETIESLSERFGSPLYVFDEKAFTKNYSHLSSAMSALNEN